MNTSRNNFVTVNEILADILPAVDDNRMEAMTRGFYTSQIQQALEGLAFDTFFDERRDDFGFPQETLSLEMPIGTFNIKNIYLYTGTKCDITRSQKVWWKKNYFTTGQGYFADNKGSNPEDPFMTNNFVGRNAFGVANGTATESIRRDSLSVENHYYYNVQNGMIMFSSVCRKFPKVHVVSNGTGCELGDIPIIPLFLREAVKDYVCETALRIRMAKDPKAWAGLWQIYDKRLNRDGVYGFDQGSWARAEFRVKCMSSSERSDLAEYLNSNQWQNGL